MTALAKDRSTPRLTGAPFYMLPVVVPVAAGAKIYTGAALARNAAGYAVPADTTPGLKALGRAEHAVDNTNGEDGDESVLVGKGVFGYVDAAGFTDADLNNPVFFLDDQTVEDAATGGEPAGILVAIDGSIAYVDQTGAPPAYENQEAEAIAAPGALSAHIRLSTLAVDGTDAFTLPDGKRDGELKSIVCIEAENVPAGTVTPASLEGFSTILFDAVGESVTLRWRQALDSGNGNWEVLHISGATLG